MGVIYDLIVVGGGYWGSGIAFEARAKGWNVLLVDSNDPYGASRAASGIADIKAYGSSIFKKYWPADWSQEDLRESFDWLMKRGGYRQREWFWNQFKGTAPREGTDCVYIPLVTTITELTNRVYDEVGKVFVFNASDLAVDLKLGGMFRGRRLVVAAGYLTDGVLNMAGLGALGVGGLYGRGLIGHGTPTVAPVSVMIRPYCKHTVRAWGNRWKVGDTAEASIKDGPIQSLRRVATLAIPDFIEEQLSEGYRPTLDRFTVEKLTPNVVVATGGHRLGLGLTGLVAKKVMEMFQ